MINSRKIEHKNKNSDNISISTNSTIVIDSESSLGASEDSNMHCDESETAHTRKKHDTSDVEVSLKPEKLEAKKVEPEEHKPRIVLTFRSEKTGAKSTNMKIVSTEEKHEEISPRRSSRNRIAKWDSDDDTLVSPKKDKTQVSETDEASDSSQTALKRSSRRRSREFSENVIANAIARKEKSYNEDTGPQRLSRRIKPTPKVLANKELRIGVESQNIARLGITPDKPQEEGVRTRRSARRKSVEYPESHKKATKHTHNSDVEMVNEDSEDHSQNVKKLRHLCELGLQAITPEVEEDVLADNDERDTEDCEEIEQSIEEDEYDDESEVISKLIEADGQVASDDSDDEEFYCSTEVTQGKPRRSTRLCSSYVTNDSEDRSSSNLGDDDQPQQRSPRRRSSRKQKNSDTFGENDDAPAGGDEGQEAICPNEESGGIVATCFCVTPSNIFAAPEELNAPVFCQAIEMVDDLRVGCSHCALKEEDGKYAALVRAGPRAPYFMACKLHTMQLRNHMCCPACGLFCTQGLFYQCSEGHLFHLDCGVPLNDSKSRPGCPHCGVHSYRWQPVNKECNKVNVVMKCSNKRIYLPEQREQCTPAYLSFSKSKTKLEQGPLIPEELLPSPPVNLKEMCMRPSVGAEPDGGGSSVERLYDAIMAAEDVEQLIPKIMRCEELNAGVERARGGTCVHAAARRGRLHALYALHYAGASLDAVDDTSRTPLILAILALSEVKEGGAKKDKKEKLDLKEDIDTDHIKAESSEQDTDKPSDEDLMKVIRYLIAAGCDINFPGPEGMTALHAAAARGSECACSALVDAGAHLDARDHGGWSPLVWAAENGHADVVSLLLSSGAEGEARDAEGNAAVHWCALGGDARALRLLLAAAPRALLAANQHGDTPLHVAARQGHYACVITLLARGARTDVENTAGELPVEVCTGKCQTAISLNMQMAVAKRNKTRCTLLSSDISRGRETHPIPCVNEVDEEPLPDDFTYVTQHVMPQRINIDCTIDNLQGCECVDSCGGATCACGVLGVRRWWARGRLAHNFPYHEPPMLFECNQTCHCDLNKCGNYVVSRLSKLGSTLSRAQVFRTRSRGWGLRAAAPVLRGAPVATYCGELIDAALADARSQDHYMFALDVKADLLEQCEDKSQLCVDAARYGSAARFINHSCAPNLAPVRVFTATRDLRLPVVTLFAIRNIKPGDEFTFDYGDKFWSVKSKWMKCECNSPDCRYPTKSTEETE